MGVRGDMTLRASVKGTVGAHQLTGQLVLSGLRRADFVPAQTLDVDVDCRAQAEGMFHLADLDCGWPGSGDGSGLTVTGDVPDTRHWENSELQARWTKVPVSALVDALRVASSRDSSAIHASGMVSGELSCCDAAIPLLASGTFSVVKARLAVGDAPPAVNEAADLDGELANGIVTVAPIALQLGGTQPAMLTLSADKTGLRMRLTGMVLRSRMMALAKALPIFGDGLDAAMPATPVAKSSAKAVVDVPVKLDLESARVWGAGQVWTPVVVKRATRRR
jgi:hypothetical protein